MPAQERSRGSGSTITATGRRASSAPKQRAPASTAGRGASAASENRALKRELAEALEQQAATSEILRIISLSPHDVQPVFDTIVGNAARLCDANFACVLRHEDDWLSLAARTACAPEFERHLRTGLPVNRETSTGRARDQ